MMVFDINMLSVPPPFIYLMVFMIASKAHDMSALTSDCRHNGAERVL